MVRIEGAGLAGRVLHRELAEAGIASALTDRSEFPRQKVCGGVLQKESWDYLKSRFPIKTEARLIESVSHFWRGKKVSRMRLSPPLVFISRFALDAQLETPFSPKRGSLERSVNATGAPQDGEWIGFQAREKGPLDELQMHYGRGICLGLSPTPENDSHVAFIVKRDRFRNSAELKRFVCEELNLELLGELKGTGRIRYGYSKNGLSIGDAKMSTFPFLGYGMKHAIDSARLLAACFAKGESAVYPERHRRIFRRHRLTSLLVGRLYDSPFQFTLRPFVSNERLFRGLYGWIHRGAVLE